MKKEGLHDQQLTFVLSGPVSLSFQIGQAIGFNYNVQLVHWDSTTHDYTVVPNLTRRILDSHSPNMKKPRKRPSVDKPVLSINIGGKGVFSALKKSFGNRVIQGVSYSEIDMVQVPSIVTEVYQKVASFSNIYDEIINYYPPEHQEYDTQHPQRWIGSSIGSDTNDYIGDEEY